MRLITLLIATTTLMMAGMVQAQTRGAASVDTNPFGKDRSDPTPPLFKDFAVTKFAPSITTVTAGDTVKLTAVIESLASSNVPVIPDLQGNPYIKISLPAGFVTTASTCVVDVSQNCSMYISGTSTEIGIQPLLATPLLNKKFTITLDLLRTTPVTQNLTLTALVDCLICKEINFANNNASLVLMPKVSQSVGDQISLLGKKTESINFTPTQSFSLNIADYAANIGNAPANLKLAIAPNAGFNLKSVASSSPLLDATVVSAAAGNISIKLTPLAPAADIKNVVISFFAHTKAVTDVAVAIDSNLKIAYSELLQFENFHFGASTQIAGYTYDNKAKRLKLNIVQTMKNHGTGLVFSPRSTSYTGMCTRKEGVYKTTTLAFPQIVGGTVAPNNTNMTGLINANAIETTKLNNTIVNEVFSKYNGETNPYTSCSFTTRTSSQRYCGEASASTSCSHTYYDVGSTGLIPDTDGNGTPLNDGGVTKVVF